jgi:hypothetical protein
LSLQQLEAQEGVVPVTIGADLDFKTRYLFAGIPFATGEVIQGKVTVGYNGLTVNAFTNYDVDAGDISEGDVWADYYHQFNAIIGGFVGGAIYNFKILGNWEATPELYAGITASVLGNPTLYFAHDFDLTTGSHATFTLSHGVPVDIATVTAVGNLDYNDGYYREGSSFSYADLNVSVAIPLGHWTITPMVTLLQGLDDDFDDQAVAGVNVHVDL